MGDTSTAREAPRERPLRFLVVTAYFREERPLLERCIQSVRAQTVEADHLLVADGLAQEWVDGHAVRHIRLDRPHADYGNTPRGVGALLAISEAYDGFCFLDGDNWLEPEHVASCLAAAESAGADCDYVIASRSLRRPDGTILPVRDEPISTHVDTNCFFFLPGSYHMLHHFSGIPRPLSAIGDRVFYAALRRQELKTAVVTHPTVNYHCLWRSAYQALSETPPEGAKPSLDQSSYSAWLKGLSPREQTLLSRRTGLPWK